MKKILLIFIVFSIAINYSQEKEDLFSLISEEQNQIELLPERMVFTQSLLWGKNGLFRKTGISDLNIENREKELRIRKNMLNAHQVIGYITLASMVAQGIIGGKLYNGDESLRNTHKTMGNIVNIGYFTGAGLSLFAPPPLINKKVKGFNSIKAHKILATIHFSAMVATNHFKDRNKDTHKAAAYTAFASYATAVLVIKF
ncbi:MAG: hypothetical protein HOB81_01405 [Flavobacteriaceae bacterium]|nr:hypothetical protein [Flavobacteriaceae bacterium]MBT4959176.1 hypothetical protein [Flavobacteriaceae bacterium]MBT6170657.1 hypothetical protein [Flavobacteriaceae bacterium]MBT6448955.1 hypothetical protein [Flavobacteriaceae bacterium]MBT7624195.1 hypothetical protein [Flavobacteriaceae bacterium]